MAVTTSGKIPKIVATFVFASSQGQRTHSARTNEERERERERERKNAIYSGHLRLCQQPRAAHALRSDQNKLSQVGGGGWVGCWIN